MIMRTTTTMTYSNNTATNLEDRLSALLSSPDNFSAAQYLNLALSSDSVTVDDNNKNVDDDDIDEYQTLERRMASVALQLQMHTRACHDDISRIGAELHAIIPRCAADVTRLRSGLEGMEMDARGMLSSGQDQAIGDGEGIKIVGIDGKKTKKMGNKRNTIEELMENVGISNSDNNHINTNPLATLRTLLTLRTHLTSTRSILAAASGWDDNMDSVPSLLAANPPDLLGAVEALVRLEAGARALHCVPGGREERDVSLRKLRSQIEAMLRPRLQHALGNMDTRLGPLRQCVEMYGALGRMTTLQEEYVRMRPAQIHALWFSFGGGGTATTLLGGKSKRGVVGNDDGGKKDRNSDGAEKDDEVKDFDFNDEEEHDFDGDGDSSSSNINSGVSSKEQPTTAASTAKQFIEFLPTFYDAVLELLATERTQSRTVFGPDLSSSVMARVLTECFRPIIGSFGKRLNSLCPTPGKGLSTIASGDGGMEAIAAVYESTVRFLSLAYDQMEAWDGHSLKEKGGNGVVRDNHASRAETLRLIQTSFFLIASPFVPYQRALADAERDPLGEAATMVAKDVRGVVNFEDAAERFEYLAPFIFPLVEAVINRFELLNSGYNASATLSSVDKLISNHAAELAIAMGTLSTNASNNSGPEFDEQHVNCALKILRIAGSFKRNLLSFQSFVRDRLMMLSKEMTEFVFDVDAAFIPDGLTPTQIRTILAKEACDPSPTYIDISGIKCPSSVAQLRRLFGSNSPALFPTALDSTARLARSCLSLVFEVCSAIPERQLRGISALPVWKQEGGASDGVEESYGVLPQPFITQVGEHMLALVQALEPFASDADSLGLANEVMTGVIDVAVQPWKEFVAAAGCSFSDDGKSFHDTLMRGISLQRYFLDDNVDGHETLEDGEKDVKEGADNEADAGGSAAFCNQWLDVVGLAVTGRLLERTMRIPRLGRKGAEHLAADISYILNVFTALGVSGHPHPLLGYVAQLVTLDDQMLRSKILERRRDGEVSDALEVIKRVELRIAYVRSIAI